MIEGRANEMPEDDFIEPPSPSRRTSRPPHRRAEGTRRCGRRSQSGRRRSSSSPTNCSKSPTKSPATASKRALYTPSKVARHKAVGALKDEVSAAILAKFPEATNFEISQAFDYLQKKAFRVSILDKQIRCDGRGLRSDLRQLSAETGLLPRAHGCALFRRGETQAVCARDPRARRRSAGPRRLHRRRDQQAFHPALQLPALLASAKPAASAALDRREIGHGALAERSIAPVIPRGRTSPTPSASPAKSWSPTAPPRWPRSAPVSWP